MTAGKLLLAIIAFVVYVPLPVSIVFGWLRWGRHRPRLSVYSTLSLIGFTLATASGLLALSAIAYAQAIHGFRYYDPRLLRIFGWGGRLSLSGIVFGIIGIWRPNPLRWYAPFCAAGMFAFWFLMAMLE